MELNKAMIEIGLKFNLKKSTAIEPTPALSREFGFTHAPTGARLLGGFIGEDDSHKKWIESLRAHNVAFFEKIRKMEPDVAFAILSKCGIPKWNHLCRVTPPHIMNELCDSFDDMAIFAFESIARLPKDGMTSESRLALHLPTAFGGLGVTQYKRISKALYDASSQGNLAPQRALTKEINKSLWKTLPPRFQQHLLRCKKERHILQQPRPSPHFFRVLQLRILSFNATPVNGQQWTCDCGVASDNMADAALHALGCVRLFTPNATSRSSAIKDVIARFCRSNSIPATVEPMVVSTNDGEQLRADIRISLPDEDVYVDVVVANGSAKSHAKKTTEELEDEKRRLKEATYLRHVSAVGASFVSFFVEAMGELGKDAAHLARRLEKAALVPKRHALREEISHTLHRNNGAIISNAFRSSNITPAGNVSQHNGQE